MPELPEVETVARGLQLTIAGRRIVSVTLGKTDFIDNPADLEQHLPGQRIARVERFGKFMLMRLSREANGDNTSASVSGDSLLVHLGMTGQLRLVDAVTRLEKHTHAVFFLDGGRQLRYRDPRRFGRLLIGTQDALLSAKKMPRLGPEPIDPDFAADELYRRLRKRRTALKAVLLDQGAIAGVGNIYADESLHRAGLRPTRLANTVSRRSASKLHESLRESLELAIANRGSSVDTYRDAWGDAGGQQEKLPED